MLEGFLGRDTLRSGLQLYLLTHEYQNADTTDLWKALSDSSPAALHVKVTFIIKFTKEWHLK